jgi:hypothetical protein
MVFFKLKPTDVEHLHRDIASVDIHKLQDFKQLCRDAWEPKHGFLVIDLSRDFESGNKYRTSLDLAK